MVGWEGSRWKVWFCSAKTCPSLPWSFEPAPRSITPWGKCMLSPPQLLAPSLFFPILGLVSLLPFAPENPIWGYIGLMALNELLLASFWMLLHHSVENPILQHAWHWDLFKAWAWISSAVLEKKWIVCCLIFTSWWFSCLPECLALYLCTLLWYSPQTTWFSCRAWEWQSKVGGWKDGPAACWSLMVRGAD